MRALVTGGAGLIGSHVVDILLDRGYDVRILDNLEPETHNGKKPSWVPEKADFIIGDVGDRQVVENALDKIDIVFHQAAYGGFAPELTKYITANSIGTANFFDVIKQKKLPIKKMVVASSQAVYGEGKYECHEHGVVYPQIRSKAQLLKAAWEVRCPNCSEEVSPLPTDEATSIDPGFIYSITKFSEEQIAIKVGQSLGIPTVALRYSLTYGPRQSLINPYTGICSIFSSRIINNMPVVVYEDGEQKRDFIFVEDVANANVFLMDNEKANYEIFNIGTGKGTTVLEFISILSEQYGKEASLNITKQFRPGEVRHLFCDNSKLTNLGFKPEVTLKEGIKKYAEWIQEETNLEDYFSKAFHAMKEKGIVVQAV